MLFSKLCRVARDPEPTWRIEKQGKGNNHESGDDRKQDDQTGINFHPAAEISINLDLKISEAFRTRALPDGPSPTTGEGG